MTEMTFATLLTSVGDFFTQALGWIIEGVETMLASPYFLLYAIIGVVITVISIASGKVNK